MQKHMLFVVRGKAIQEHIHQVGGIHSTKLTGEFGKNDTHRWRNYQVATVSSASARGGRIHTRSGGNAPSTWWRLSPVPRADLHIRQTKTSWQGRKKLSTSKGLAALQGSDALGTMLALEVTTTQGLPLQCRVEGVD